MANKVAFAGTQGWTYGAHYTESLSVMTREQQLIQRYFSGGSWAVVRGRGASGALGSGGVTASGARGTLVLRGFT